MHIEYIPQMLIVWVNEFYILKGVTHSPQKIFLYRFFCLQPLVSATANQGALGFGMYLSPSLLPGRSSQVQIWASRSAPGSKGAGGGCWNPQVATSQPCQNKVPVFSDFCQLCSLSLYTCVFPGQLEIHEFLQSASPLVAFCLHTCSPFCLACPFWTCSSFEKGSSTISCWKPLHPLFQLSLGFLLFATDTFTMLYCNFWSPCLPFLLDLGHIESRNPGPSFLPILPQGLPVNTGWVGGWMDGDV